MPETKVKAYGFIAREYVNLGEGPHKNVVRTVVSQARLAEPITVLQQQDGWYEVEMSDTYHGWVSPLDVVLTSKAYWQEYQNSAQVLVTSPFVYIYTDNDFCPVGKDATTLVSGATLGTRLKLVAEEGQAYRVILPTGKTGLVPMSEAKVISNFSSIPRGSIEAIIALGKQFLGLPYFWGGTTPYGYDCSGFMQTLFMMNGVHLLRDAHQQYEQGELVANRTDLIKGDVVFWSTYKPGASHVGIYLGNNEYIHSGGQHGVAINSFDPTKENYREDLDEKYLAPED